MTTEFDHERRAVEKLLASAVTSFPITPANVKFSPPAAGGVYGRLAILDGNGFQASIGADRYLRRHPGVIQVTIHVPQDTGTAGLRQKADLVANAMRRRTISAGDAGTIITGIPSFVELGDEGGYYLGAVSIPFSRDVF